MRRTIELTELNGQNGPGILSVQLPMGLDYMALYFVDTAAALAIANLTDQKMYLGSDLVRQYTGVIQDSALNQGDRLPAFATDNILSEHFDQIGMKNVLATYGTTINTLSPDPQTGKIITTARVEVTTTVNAPVWRVFADVDDSSAGGPGFVERIRTYGNLTLGTAERSFATVFPFGTPDVRFWRRLYVHNLSAGTITEARLMRGSAQNEVFKRTAALDARIIGDYRLRDIVAPVDFLIDGTETGIPETWDTMKRNPAKVNGAPNVAALPDLVTVGLMDLRLTNSAAATGSITLNTIGSL